MPIIRNPGPWSFAIFAAACILVGFLFWRGAPEAIKLAGSLVGVAVAAFGAKSALAAKPSPDLTTSQRIAELVKRAPVVPPQGAEVVPPRGRPPLETWPGKDGDS